MPIVAKPQVDEDGVVCLLRAAQYVVAGSLGFETRNMRTAHITFDTGAGVNIIRQNMLPAGWQNYLLNDLELPALGDANGRRLEMLGAVELRVRLGHCVYRTTFYVASRLAVPVIIGTGFMNTHVRAIWCMDQQLQLARNRYRLPILAHGNIPRPSRTPDESTPAVEVDGDRQPDIKHPKSTPKKDRPLGLLKGVPLRLAKAVILDPFSQNKVSVVSREGGLLVIEPRAQLATNRLVSASNGIAEAKPNVAFNIFLANFSKRTVRLQKGQIIAQANRTSVGVQDLTPQVTRGFVASILSIPEADLEASLPDDGKSREPSPTNGATLPKAPDKSNAEEDWREKLKLEHVDERMRTEIMAMLERHQHMWAKNRLGEISATEHRIELKDGTTPIRQQAYRQGLKRRQQTEAAVKQMLDAGVIEPANTEWASPVVLAPKPDGSQRFCVDYRKLNMETVADAYPLPRADDCLDSLGGADIFTTLDCNSGYWQIPVAERDRDKTAFTTHMGLFRYLRMPFGLRNAPATFQRALDIILSGVKWQTCLIYLDDVIVFGKSTEQHLKDVDEVLTLLGDAGVSLKIRKCEFFQPRVNYLGHVITPGKLSIATNRVAGFEKAKFPENKPIMRSFLGAANYYRRFIRSFAGLARPLNAMLKQEHPSVYGDPTAEQMTAFEALKQALLHPPILALPILGLPLMLDTDASAYQLGAALLQQRDPTDDKTWEPIGFYSKTLTAPERNYSATERECYAVVWGVTTLRPYVEGQKFVVRTDHDALKWLMTLDDPSGRLARWRLRLSEFDMRIMYRPGKKHQVPDALSRLKRSDDTTTIQVDDEIPGIDEFILVTTRRQRRALAQTPTSVEEHPAQPPIVDNTETEVIDATRTPTPSSLTGERHAHLACRDHPTHFHMEDDDMFIDHRPDHSPTTSREFEELPSALTTEEIVREQQVDSFCQTVLAKHSKYSSFFEDGDGVLRRRLPFDEELTPIVLPAPLRPRTLQLMHSTPIAGHPGQTRMYANMRRLFYWPHMAADVFATVQHCPSCARERIKQRKRQHPLILFPAEGPLEDVAVDLVGPFPATKKGYKMILVISDRFSKLTQVVPLRNTEAYDCALAFVEHWVYKYGSPLRVVSDNGPQFVARFFQAVCRILGVQTTSSTSYHPQTNGQVERYNRSLLAMLRHFVGEHQDDWDVYAGAVTHAYNLSVHRSTGTTPFDLVLSRPPPPFVVQFSTRNKRSAKSKQLSKDFATRLHDTLAKAKGNLEAAQARYKSDFDKRIKHKLPTIETGDWVWLDPVQRSTATNKLTPAADKRYRVLSSGRGTIVIKRDDLVERVNRSRVELAPPPTPTDTATDPRSEHDEEPTNADFAEKTTGDEWVVERVLDHSRDFDGRLWFHIEWRGPHANSWQPRRDLDESMVAQYFTRLRRRHEKERQRTRQSKSTGEPGPGTLGVLLLPPSA